MSWFTTAFGPHYPVLYAHRDAAEARRAVAAVTALAPLGAGPVLDLGCGAGRHLATLAEAGVRVLGLDLSASLVRQAARESEGLLPAPWLTRGDMRQLPLCCGSFTAVLSLFTAFGYFGALPAHDGVVAEISRVLRPGGHWFLDYLNCAEVRAQLRGQRAVRRQRRAGPLVIRETRRLRGPQVIKSVELRPAAGGEREAQALGVPAAGLRYVEEVALFEIEELDQLCARHALRRVAEAGGYGHEALSAASARWLLAYRRLEPEEEAR